MTLASFTNWHRLALIAIALVLPWINPFASSPSTGVIPLLLSWMMCACLVLAISDVPQQRVVIHPSRSYGLVVWGVLLLVLLLSVPRQIDHAVTLGLWCALACIGLSAYAAMRVVTGEPILIRVLVGSLLFAALLNAVIGVLQYLDLASPLAPWVDIPYYKGDAFGNLRQRNQFATLMSLGWIALWWWQAHRAIHSETPIRRIGLIVIWVLLAIGSAISISRTGLLQWMSLSVGSLLWCWQQKRQGREVDQSVWRLGWCSPVLFVVASAVMPYVAQAVTGVQGASLIVRVAGGGADYSLCAGRGVLWGNILEMVGQHPWLGWGWAQTDYAHFMTLFKGPRFCDMLDNAHDLPLHIAIELGVPFAVCSVALALWWVWQRRPDQEQDVTRLMGWAILWALLLHSLLEYPLWYGPFQISLGLAIGLLWGRSTRQVSESGAKSFDVQAHPWAVVAMTLAGVLFVGCLYAAWDFNRVGQIYKSPAARDQMYLDDPLGHAMQSWVFQNQAEFAKLTTAQVTPDNAQEMYDLGNRLLSYSPEERVVTRLIEAARLLGKDEEADFLQVRLEAMKQSLKRQ